MDFNEKTFRYLDLAKKNQFKLQWFEKNATLYQDHVRRPLADFVAKLWATFQDDLPKIKISPKRISRPTRSIRMLESGKPMVKPNISVYFAEPATSRFEWNPGIFFELSADPEGNVLKVGIYDLISSRQTRLLRQEISENYEEFHQLLTEKNLKRRFGGLQGETYKRFPKQLDASAPSAQYLKHKLFYLSRTYTREEVTKKNFQTQLLKDLTIAMPFLHWLLRKVPVYKRDLERMGQTPQVVSWDEWPEERL